MYLMKMKMIKIYLMKMYILTTHTCMGVSGPICLSSSQRSLHTTDTCVFPSPCLERLLFSMCLSLDSLTDFLIHSFSHHFLHCHPVSCLHVGFSLAIIYYLPLLHIVTLKFCHFSSVEPGMNPRSLWASLQYIYFYSVFTYSRQTSSLHIVRKPSRGTITRNDLSLKIYPFLDFWSWLMLCSLSSLMLLNNAPCLQHQRQTLWTPC